MNCYKTQIESGKWKSNELKLACSHKVNKDKTAFENWSNVSSKVLKGSEMMETVLCKATTL